MSCMFVCKVNQLCCFQVRIGDNFSLFLGSVLIKKKNSIGIYLYPLLGIFGFLTICCGVGLLWYKRKRDQIQERDKQAFDKRMEEEYRAAAHASRNGELDLVSTNVINSAAIVLCDENFAARKT